MDFSNYLSKVATWVSLLCGCRVYYQDKGSGVIEPQPGAIYFKIVFGDIKPRWWQFWKRVKRDEISVGRDAFATGQITSVTLSELPGDFIRASLPESFQKPPQSSDATTATTEPFPQIGHAHLPRPHAIQALCRERQIQDLVHFTRIEHVKNILAHGLLSRSALAQLPVGYRPLFNDSQRFDGQLGSISLSISHPNYKMFYKYRRINPSAIWVVITLSIQILWELDCAFCVRNAATREISCIPLPERNTYYAFERMFGEVGSKCRTELGLLPHYTTDPQAEVLVLEHIAPSMIKSVCFFSERDLNLWCTKYGGLPSRAKFRIDRNMFAPRFDYTYWN